MCGEAGKPGTWAESLFYFTGDIMKDEKVKQLQRLLGELTKEDLSDALIKKTIEVKELIEGIKDVEPKVSFHDAVTESDDQIEMSSVAKLLNFKGMGRNKLFELLRTKNILMYNNEPYQEYVGRGYFKVIEQRVDLPNGDLYVNKKTVVFQKGLDYIHKLLLETGHEHNDK